ncbi:MAG: phosphate signaling complex protein PhoU [Pseudomonadota bacterium]
MSIHLERELDRLKRDVLTCGAMVEEAIEKSMVALDERRVELAEKVVQEDEKIDQLEVEIEESCLKILALHQPVAQDLRFLAAVIRINNDLERVGDYAVSIAERTLEFAKFSIPTPKNLKVLGGVARQMLRDSLDSFVKRDSGLARKVCSSDSEADRIHREVFQEIRDRIFQHPDQIDALLDLLTTARRLERIADMATNIAQDVVYMVEGKIIRHRWVGESGSNQTKERR